MPFFGELFFASFFFPGIAEIFVFFCVPFSSAGDAFFPFFLKGHLRPRLFFSCFRAVANSTIFEWRFSFFQLFFPVLDQLGRLLAFFPFLSLQFQTATLLFYIAVNSRFFPFRYPHCRFPLLRCSLRVLCFFFLYAFLIFFLFLFVWVLFFFFFFLRFFACLFIDFCFSCINLPFPASDKLH